MPPISPAICHVETLHSHSLSDVVFITALFGQWLNQSQACPVVLDGFIFPDQESHRDNGPGRYLQQIWVSRIVE